MAAVEAEGKPVWTVLSGPMLDGARELLAKSEESDLGTMTVSALLDHSSHLVASLEIVSGSEAAVRIGGLVPEGEAVGDDLRELLETRVRARLSEGFELELGCRDLDDQSWLCEGTVGGLDHAIEQVFDELVQEVAQQR